MRKFVSSRSLLLASLVLALALVAPAAASFGSGAQQQQPAVAVTLDGSVTRDGKAVSVDGQQLSPGEVITWSVRVNNRSSKTLANVRAEGLVPKGTVFVADSFVGTGARAEFSIDNGRTYSARPTITVAGKVKPAPVESYTNILFVWDGDLAPGQLKVAQYKTRLR